MKVLTWVLRKQNLNFISGLVMFYLGYVVAKGWPLAVPLVLAVGFVVDLGLSVLLAHLIARKWRREAKAGKPTVLP